MNSKVVLIGLTILAIGVYFFIRPKTPKTDVPPTPTSNNATEITTGQSTSRYQPYTKVAFDSAAAKKRVYFFHAPWCPTCIPANSAFETNHTSIPEDVVLFKTDYDSSDALKKQYAITYQHTFVLVDEKGNEIEKWNGGALEELITNTQ
jgi:thioredoxin 1